MFIFGDYIDITNGILLRQFWYFDAICIAVPNLHASSGSVRQALEAYMHVSKRPFQSNIKANESSSSRLR
jgi:hypothetical protein